MLFNIQNRICITSNSSHAYTKYIKATTWHSSQLSASRERCLPTRDLYLKGGVGGVPLHGELRLVEIKPTRATPHLGAYANDHFTVTQTTQSAQNCCPNNFKKKTTCMYETALYMPHVPGQPPTHHPMQMPMGNQY